MASIGRLVKESIVKDIASELTDKSNLFIASVNRLPASEANVFRQKLHSSQARLVMIKRRLSKRALSQLKITGLDELLEESVGFILPLGEDILPVAKTLVEFGKAHEEQMSIRGAWVDGQLLDGKTVKALADLPSRPVLLAQVLGTIEAPLADVIFTIERLIGDLAWLAEAAKTKPATEPRTPPQAGSAKEVPNAEGGGTQPNEQPQSKPLEGGAPA